MPKPSHSEEEFFAKEDAEKRHQLHTHAQREAHEKARAHAKALHYMKCPKCGDDLKSLNQGYVEIDQCPSCRAIVLDAGELEKIVAEESSVLKSFVDFFRK